MVSCFGTTVTGVGVPSLRLLRLQSELRVHRDSHELEHCKMEGIKTEPAIVSTSSMPPARLPSTLSGVDDFVQLLGSCSMLDCDS